MSTHVHTIETQWRDRDADALMERSQAIGEWLEHTEDLVEMFSTKKNNDEIITSLQGLSGLVRSRKNDILQEAEKLRMAVIDREPKDTAVPSYQDTN